MAKLVFVLLCLNFAASVYCRDDTLTGGSGEDVVDAVINKIQSSCTFPNSKHFMKRIAAVNTNNGKNMKSNNGGIWKIQRHMLWTVKYYCRTFLRRYCNAVLRVFNVNIGTLAYKDMDIPLKSGLIMRAYLRAYLVNIPAPKSTQAWLWRILISNEPESTFLSKNTIKPACFFPKVDLIFAIDASGSITTVDFYRKLMFLKAVVGGLNIGNGFVRVGVIRFATGADVSIALKSHSNLASLRQKIDAIPYTGGSTNTAAALNLASTTFKNDRPDVPKVLIMITDGYSNSYYSTITAANNLKSKNVTIFTIGFGRVKDYEMRAVASAPSCTHFFKMNSYGEIIAIVQQIQRAVCESPFIVDGTATDVFSRNNKLPPNGYTKVQRLIVYPSNTTRGKTTIRVNVVCGVVYVYTSTSYPKPNAALYDDKSYASEGVSAWIHNDPNRKLYVSFVSEIRPNSANPHCTNPHYNISVNPKNTYIEVVCKHNGVERKCTDDEIIELFKHLFDNTNQPNIKNPCTNDNIVNSIMRFPYPNDRNKYIQCDITGRMEIVTCPTGTNYNEDQSVCSPHVTPPINGKVFNGPNPCTISVMVAGKFYFIHPSKPEAYIQCTVQGVPLVQFCPENTLWSQKATTCVPNSVRSYNPCDPNSSVRFYSDPTNNTLFIQCDDNDNAFVMPCAPSTVWSQVDQACIINSTPASSKCDSNSCTAGEYCPFPGNKQAYYVCDNGKLKKMNCANGLVWDKEFKTCNFP